MSAARCWSLAGLALALASCGAPPEDDARFAWPTPRRGMVVSEHPLATAAGLDVLDAGGNAVDAAVACALALAVVYPQAGNLGGGGFALWVPHDERRPARALDFRECGPAELRAELFLEQGELVPERAQLGALAAAVPGTPAGLWVLQRELGVLDFDRVARRAIELAQYGFAVDAWLAHDLADDEHAQKLLASPGAAALFYPGGDALREGDRLVQRELARTLERYAREGPRALWQGELGEALDRESSAGGGVLRAADVAAYEARWREPLRGWFRGYELFSVPPPSSGGLVLMQVLAVLDGFPLDAEREEALGARGTAPGGVSARGLHWWIEALRGAFADRAMHLGDPDHYPVPAQELLSPEWIAARRIAIGEQAQPGVEAWAGDERESEQTTHLCVLDTEGNALSLTTTLNASFGGGVLVRGAGYLLNNEIDDFALAPGAPNLYGLVGSQANAPGPGRRPLSSMTPLVLRDSGNTVALVLGSPGGPRIISSLVQVLLRRLVYGQDLAAAIAAPRLHQQAAPEWTEFEPGFDESVLRLLRDRGHDARTVDRRWASVQAIEVEAGGEPIGVSDARRGGVAGAQGRPLPEPARPR